MTNKHFIFSKGNVLAAFFTSTLLSCGGNADRNPPEDTEVELPPFLSAITQEQILSAMTLCSTGIS